MPPAIRSSSPRRSHLDEEDSIEDDDEGVQLVAGRTPNSLPSRPRPDFLDYKVEELQHLSNDRLSKKRGSSTGVPIPVPGARGRSSVSLLAGALGPVNTLNKPQHSRSPIQNKRKLTQSEALADQPFRPKRQKEDSIVLKDLSKAIGSSASTMKDSDAKKSKHFSQTSRDATSEPLQSSLQAVSEDADFKALVDSVPMMPTQKGSRIPADSWVSESSDPQHTRWKATPKRTQHRPKKTVFSLARFQRGSTVVKNTCSHDNCRGLVIEKSNIKDSKEYKVMHGSEEAKDLTFQVDKIRKINLGNLKKCAIDLRRELSSESQSHIMFTFRNESDSEAFVQDAKLEGLKADSKNDSWWESRVNGFKDWVRRDNETLDQELVIEPVVERSQPTHRGIRKESIERGATSDSFEVVIPADSKKPLQQTRRLTRGSFVPGNPEVSEKVGRFQEVEKPEKVKRRRGSLTDEAARESRSPKVRKLELPKPKWLSSLVYPFEGPKKQVVEYEDLARLGAEEFLNDNLINFYLRYIEVELQKRDPDLAKETYFLNTFFYEILARKGGKGKKNFDNVLKWTAKVDLFNMNYIVIPINESSHWYLAIICNLQNLERKMQNNAPMSPVSAKTIDLESSSATLADDRDGKERDQDELVHLSDSEEMAAQRLQASAQVSVGGDDPGDTGAVECSHDQMSPDEDEWPKEDLDEPLDLHQAVMAENAVELIASKTAKGKAKVERPNRRSVPADTPAIIILDSMGYGSSSRPTTIKNLKDYLAAEALNKRNLEITRGDINATYAKAPNQNNYYDCGPYLLHYVERFFEQPKEFVAAFLAREDVKLDKELWRKDEIKGMRSKIFDVIVDLREQFENFELAKARGEIKGNGLKKDDNERGAAPAGKGKEAEISVHGEEDIAVEIEDGDCVMEGEAVPDGPSNASSLSSPKSTMSTSKSPVSRLQKKRDEDSSRAMDVLGIRSKPRVSGVA